MGGGLRNDMMAGSSGLKIANSMYLMEHKAQLTNGGLPVRVWVQVFGDTFRLAWTAAHFFYYNPTLVCCSRVV